MADEGSYWGDKHRPFAKIGTDPQELAELADAIVRGASICHAEIADFGKLLDAIQEHPKARLVKADETGSPLPYDYSKTPTILTIRNSSIASCMCRRAVVQILLKVEARFACDVDFARAIFTAEGFMDAGTKFDNSIFAGSVSFDGVMFVAGVSFDNTSFLKYASFQEMSVSDDLSFSKANFHATAALDASAIHCHTSFDKARFADCLSIDECYFEEIVTFSDTAFENGFTNENTSFIKAPWLSDTYFSGGCDAQVDARLFDVRTVRFGSTERDLKRLPLLRTIHRFLTRRFGWTIVRGIGQLGILTRVSILALIAVPVAAWAWPAIRYAFRTMELREPDMGASLALAFFAAVFVTLGQLIYQVRVPERIRKHDEDGFVEWLHQRYPEGAPDRDDGLRRATDALVATARLRPDRHASFVTHHGETVWIPPTSRIDWFQDPTDETGADESTDGDDPAKPPVEPASTVEERQKRALPEGIIPGAERARIAIEEGARAEYWLAGREALGWAWASFFCYAAAVMTLLAILFIQCWSVSAAAGWGWLGIVVMVLIVAVIPAGAFLLGRAKATRQQAG